MEFVLLLFVLPALWVVPFVLCIRLIFRPAAEPRVPRLLAMGLGWQALWTAPLPLAQMVFASRIWPHITFDPWWERLPSLWFPWLVHVGGASVVAVFDDTAKAVTGHRQTTLIDNLHYFAALTLLQALVLAAVFALRFRSTRRLEDPVLLGLGLLALVNGIGSLGFEWWGT